MTFLLIAHSWLRWVVLFSGFIAVAGLLARREGGRASLIYTIALDTEVLLGITLYFVNGWASVLGPAAMHDDLTRFWTVEHGFGMLVALVVAHIGRVAARRAATPETARKRLLIALVVSLVAILLTIPWPGLPYGRPLARM